MQIFEIFVLFLFLALVHLAQGLIKSETSLASLKHDGEEALKLNILTQDQEEFQIKIHHDKATMDGLCEEDDDDDEKLLCYSGQIHVNNTEWANVTLSTCSECKSSQAEFTGLITVLGDDKIKYMVEPFKGKLSTFNISESEVDKDDIKYLHIIEPIPMPQEDEDDEIQIELPDSVLNNLIDKLNRTTQNAKNSSSKEENGEEENEVEVQMDEDKEDLADFIVQPMAVNRIKLKNRLQGKLRKARIGSKAKTGLNRKWGAGSKNRKLLAAKSQPTERVVEVAIFGDEALYQLWKNRFPKDPMSALKTYFKALFLQTQLLYSQSSLNLPIQFEVVKVEIWKKQPKDLPNGAYETHDYLHRFCKYATNRNKDGTQWDHAMLVSGSDLGLNGKNGTLGVAYISGMCVPNLSCSLAEGISFEAAITFGHELGHNLGVKHDGKLTEGTADCSPKSFIMSPSTGPGKTSWSACSKRQMAAFLEKGSMIKKIPVPSCLLEKTSKTGKALNFMSSPLPGKVYDVEKQCSMVCSSCTPVTTGFFKNPCKALYCHVKDKGARYIHPALEGTSCGKNKVCKQGNCVTSQ